MNLRAVVLMLVVTVFGAACSTDAATVTAAPSDRDATTAPIASPTPSDGGTAGSLTAAEVVEYSCTPFPTYSEGPHYLEDIETRTDLRDGVEGVPLTVRLTLVDAVTCDPLDGRDIDLWGAAPSGFHSGLLDPGAPDDGLRWLRGRTTTTADGRASFTTIFPGWVGGMPPHLTLTTPVGDEGWFTARLALDDAVAESIYLADPAYRERGAHPVRSVERADPASVVVPQSDGEGYVIDVELPVARELLRQPPVSAHLSRSPIIDEYRPPDVILAFEELPDEVRAMFVGASEELGLDTLELYDAFKEVGPTSPPDIPAIAEELGVTVDALAAALPILAAGAPSG